jgi:RND family efflux transporter MFP subunit
LGNKPANRSAEKYDGKIRKISLSANTVTRLFRVEVELASAANARPGTLSYVQVKTYQANDTIAVPLRAVISKQNESYVFVINQDNIGQKRLVKTGRMNDDSYEILTGLEPGEKIVIYGQNRLSDGEKVLVLDEKKSENGEGA